MSKVFIGADIQTVTKALAYKAALIKILGATPTLDMQKDYIRIYYTPDQLQIAQNNLQTILDKKDSSIQFEVAPVILPVIGKRYWKELLAIFAGMYLLSKFV